MAMRVHLWTCPHFGIAGLPLLEESKNQQAVPLLKRRETGGKVLERMKLG
jgi:hypothetical protein